MSGLKTVGVAALVVGMVFAPEGADAQRKSQFGTLTQEVSDSLRITLEYSRPIAKGRELYGGIVKWEKIWTPGANKATTVEFSHDVTVAGTAVPAGVYTLWFVPRESGEWSLVINTVAEAWHFRYPGEEAELTRIDVSPEDAEHMEVLAFYFPLVTDVGTTLAFHWGQQRVLIPIAVAW